MPASDIYPYLVKISGVKSLLSNHYMHMPAFFKKLRDAIISRMWKIKRAKNSRYEDIEFLKVFFFSEIIGRSIHDTSEMLNEYF